ncbi:Mpv17/PMP22 family protein [Amylocarpus encephaloides]|uniref:Mpv17/PMP22 family protein n=1 Tax=Amylocarpus encephaloides TaxID=45428 RepID=A0A9P7YLN8_9HELO|nr:Mpv17/PMP22 family protein [Amylocarpus encephaloides]
MVPKPQRSFYVKMPSPILNATIQGCVLAALSNMVAQTISAYKTGASHAINWTPIVQFIFFCIMNTPPNFMWQSYLESAFPSTYTSPTPSAIAAAATNNDKELDREEKKHEMVEEKLSVPNTLIKFFLDQTIGAALNTVMFSLAMAGFRRATFQQAVWSAREEFWPLMSAGWTLWPAVSALNFTVVRSVELRQLVGGLAGFGWNVYLSLLTE